MPSASVSSTVLTYLVLSLALTLHSKIVLQWHSFGFPWLVTSVHSLSCILGMQLIVRLGFYKPTRLTDQRQRRMLWMFSLLYTLNIAASNVSLYYVSVPLHQVVRGTVPVFTVVLTRLAYKAKYSAAVYLTLVPVVLGVALATYGDYHALSLLGLLLTLLGTLLASLKTVVTNRLLIGGYDFFRLGALDLLYHLSPLAFVQTFMWALVGGEARAAAEYLQVVSLDGPGRLALLLAGLAVNGIIAFLLNIASFSASKRTSALAMTVTGNVKVVLTVVLGCYLFRVVLGPVSVLGVVVTLAGGVAYSTVRYREAEETRRLAARSTI